MQNNFLNLAAEFEERASSLQRILDPHRFRQLFHEFTFICSTTWKALMHENASSGNPEHIVWTMLFLKTNATEVVLYVEPKQEWTRKLSRSGTEHMLNCLPN